MTRTTSNQWSLILLFIGLFVNSADPHNYGPVHKRWKQTRSYPGDTQDIFYVEASHLQESFPTVVPPTPTMQDLVRSVGYPLEEYEVQTEDGYILTVFRIPHGKNETRSPKTPVLVQHGIFSCSAAWVISEPSKGLGFVLADAGFDVWLSNSRGNAYSMKHIKYDPRVNAKEFFDFSFHEMGYYDLPAVIDFILNKTSTSEIAYIGHSQGTSQFFAMAATRPEYNRKVKAAAALAPIAFLDEMRGTVPILGAFSGFLGVPILLRGRLATSSIPSGSWTKIQYEMTVYALETVHNMLWRLCKWLGIYHVLSDSPLIHFVDTLPCEKTSPVKEACKYFLFALEGFDVNQFNQSLMPLIAGIGPSGGASTKDLIHYGQLSKNGGKFVMYDYGKSENQKRYGQDDPPNYDLEKIVMPVNLHYALNDWLVGADDVMRLHSRLNHSVKVEVPYPSFNHLDFMWAKDVRTLLYDDVISMLRKAFN